MSMKSRIAEQLTAGLEPIRLDIADESDQHAGHGGAREGGESHFRVLVVSPLFAGRSKVQRHRMVYALLTAEFAEGVHALALQTLAPGEP